MPEQKTHSGTDRRYRLIIRNSAATPIIAREIEPSMLTTMSPLTDNSSNTIRSGSSRFSSNVVRLSSLFTGTLPAPASAGRVPCFSPHKKALFFPEDDPWLFPMDVYLEYGRYLKISDAETFWPLIVKLDLLMYFPSNHGYLWSFKRASK